MAFTQSAVGELPEGLGWWVMFNNARKLTYFEKTTFLFGRLIDVFHLLEDTADTYSFLLPIPATGECVDFLCRKCFLIATKIPVCGKGQPSSSPSFLPLPQQKLSLWPI